MSEQCACLHLISLVVYTHNNTRIKYHMTVRFKVLVYSHSRGKLSPWVHSLHNNWFIKHVFTDDQPRRLTEGKASRVIGMWRCGCKQAAVYWSSFASAPLNIL